MPATFSSSDDFIDIRDVIARVEQLEKLRQPGPVDLGDEDDNETDQDTLFAELATLEALLGDLRGNGGDHDWRDAWYPVTLINETYFHEYAQDFAEDMHGDAIRNASWPMNHIDWDAATESLRMDYSTVEFEDATYLYR